MAQFALKMQQKQVNLILYRIEYKQAAKPTATSKQLQLNSKLNNAAANIMMLQQNDYVASCPPTMMISISNHHHQHYTDDAGKY